MTQREQEWRERRTAGKVLVHRSIYKPAHRDGKAHAYVWSIYCNVPDGPECSCPLYQRGLCTHADGALLSAPCPYGMADKISGPTGKAYQGLDKFIDQWRGTEPTPNVRGYHTDRMYTVGDYVVLPYPFMGMCEAAFGEGAKAFFGPGRPWIARSDWNAATVQKLIDFRPQALMGGEIVDYRFKSLPTFLYDLSFADPALYAEVMALAVTGRVQYENEVAKYGIAQVSKWRHQIPTSYHAYAPTADFFKAVPVSVRDIPTGTTITMEFNSHACRGQIERQDGVTWGVFAVSDYALPLDVRLSKTAKSGGRVEMRIELDARAVLATDNATLRQELFASGAYFPNLFLYKEQA